MRSFKRITPKPHQESVWDYPRPPKCEPFNGHIRVVHGGEILADTNAAYRILETSHPPVYYIPPADVEFRFLEKSSQQTFCEFKGMASYFHFDHKDRQVPHVAWYYPDPYESFAKIKNYLAFYAHKVDACYVNDERVQAQEGDFYGGWITSNIVGPFKGGRGTWGW